MRALLLAVACLGGCTVPLAPRLGLNIGGESRVSHHANAPRPKLYFGLRLSLIHPR